VGGGAATRLRYFACRAAEARSARSASSIGQHDLGLAHLSAELAILPLVTGLTYGLMRSLVFHASAAEQLPNQA